MGDARAATTIRELSNAKGRTEMVLPFSFRVRCMRRPAREFFAVWCVFMGWVAPGL
jgi:hypothetical protein